MQRLASGTTAGNEGHLGALRACGPDENPRLTVEVQQARMCRGEPLEIVIDHATWIIHKSFQCLSPSKPLPEPFSSRFARQIPQTKHGTTCFTCLIHQM